MSYAALTAFWAVSFLLVLTPGADWAYVISAGLRGRRLVLPATLGLACGALLATLAVAAGVGALVARNPALLTALTATGALYLAWLGVGLWRSPTSISTAAEAETGTRWHWTVKGASVSGLNPKQLLLLLALLPQFVQPGDSWPVFAQIMVLGAVHAASCAVVYFGVGWGSQSVLRSRPAAALAVSRLSGSLMLAIATVLLGEIAVQHL
ncbi:LysE family translocator [Comamonas testosteroni]|uniref:LysE family translocator n=1 Tax=Comamonas testosteroni TaxID=285 RepID=UPI002DB5803A|nr:LysE family translocator [Comamonas testosteroni]MEB5966566.1 LysE family translocator [Comamonas testosteroni]